MPWAIFSSTFIRPSYRDLHAILRVRPKLFHLAIVVAIFGPWMGAAAQAKPSTTTSLVLTSGGSTVTTVTAGKMVTLTASVHAGATSVTTGVVNFCDASAKYCTDIHIVGSAQITSSGTATLNIRPANGSHSYKAVFVGTTAFSASSSGASSLSVSGPFSSFTAISQSGSGGNYSLTATVNGSGKSPAGPSGQISFLDTSSNNSVLATATLENPVFESLANAANPAVGNQPGGIVVADFNGDGNLDIAAGINVGAIQSQLSVLLSDGTGNFVPAGTPMNITGEPALVKDFNGDGHPDILVTYRTGGDGTVLLGNGDGTFATAPGSPFYNFYGTSPSITGDFNGDGIPDVALAGGYYLQILLGNGDGSFTLVPVTTSNIYPASIFTSMSTADLNGDGRDDLIIADEVSNTFRVLLSNGDGTFHATSGTAPALNDTSKLAVADFNGDGKFDVALAPYGAPDKVAVFPGNGDGTFGAPVTSAISVGNTPFLGSVGDFNGDGIADLLVGAQTSGTTVNLLQGKGDGTFTLVPTGLAGLPCCSNATVGDVNGDGSTDIIASSFYYGSASVLLSQISQSSVTVNNINPPGAGTHQVVASFPGDVNFNPSISGAVALQSQVAVPVLTPVPGTYTSVITITMTDATPGATIYYQASGAFWTNDVVPYTGPITLSAEGLTQFQISAKAPGYVDGGYSIAKYTLLLPQAATPTVSLASGNYQGPQTVTITDSTAGAKIYYTTNGTRPTPDSNLYTGPITVSDSETLVAVAVSYGYTFSDAATTHYIIASSSPSLIYTIAGTGTFGYTGDNQPATSTELNSPSGVARDSAGNVYFSDTNNHMVRKIVAGSGIVTRIAGTGAAGYAGDGGPATSAELEGPSNLVLDSLGNLFIADNLNGTVRKVNLTTGVITTYAGNPTATTVGDGGPATAASLGSVLGIAMDASRNLYISAFGNVIRRVDASTGIISTIAGTGAYGYSGDSGPAINAAFRYPSGLTFDGSGNLYIADRMSGVVRKITATNGLITGTSLISTVAGTSSDPPAYSQGGYSGDGGPATSAALNQPAAVAVDQSGNLYIADTYNSVIRKVTASTGIISTVVGNGAVCVSYSGDGYNSTNASLCYPYDVTVDSAGNIYIADTSYCRIRKAFAPATPPSVQAAEPTFSLSSGTYDGGQRLTISDSTPGAAIYVSVDGSMPTTASAPGYSFPITIAGAMTVKAVATAPGYLTSEPASAAYNITSFSPIITTVAGNGVGGFSGAGGPALNAQFNNLQGLAVDKSGNIYAADYQNGVVWLISATTGKASIFAGGGTGGDGGPASNAGLLNPNGIALDSAGNLYIADESNHLIRKVSATTGVISTVAGGGAGTGGNNGDGGPATEASLQYPEAVAIDSADNLYIADTTHSLIRKVNVKTGIITTVAGNGTNLFTGDGGPATKAGILTPISLTVDKAGNIYFGSFISGRLRKVNAQTGIIATVAGIEDIRGNTGDGGPATSAEIDPDSVTLDAAGNLYISSWPGQIRKVDVNTGVITTVAGIGFPGFTGDGGAALSAEFRYPVGIAFDSSGDLFIADAYNYRIRKLAFTAQSAATPVFSIASGTYATAQNVTITDTTAGAAIYYTTDGSTPTASSTSYTNPITVNSTQTIKAIATAAGYNTSAVASASYIISVMAPSPSLTSLSPAFIKAGNAAFTLTVNGAGFTPTSTINWGTTPLVTQFVNASELTAQVSAAQIATSGVVPVVVQTPAPGGGTTNAMSFEIDSANSGTPPSIPSTTVTVTAGASATYPVTLPPSATNVSVNCLNLPPGAVCTYSSSAGALVITTSGTTPPGTYQITAVFTETLPGAAAVLTLLPLLLLPRASSIKRKGTRLWVIGSAGLIFAVLAVGGCGGGGGGGSTIPPPPPQTHQVTSSATLTLIVK